MYIQLLIFIQIHTCINHNCILYSEGRCFFVSMDRGRRTVKFYGLVAFQCNDGYLATSGLSGSRLFLRSPGLRIGSTEEPLPFYGFSDACVFRVVPVIAAQDATSAAGRLNGDNQANPTSLWNDAKQPASPSMMDLIDVEELTYGKSFSLIHVASGLYVSVSPSTPSENDPDCMSVVLVHQSLANSPSCCFVFVSRYKIHADGDKLCQADNILLRLASTPVFLHVSAPPGMVQPQQLQQQQTSNGSAVEMELLCRRFRCGSRHGCLNANLLNRDGPPLVQLQTANLQGSFAPLTSGCEANRECCDAAGDAELHGCADQRIGTAAATAVLTREYLDEVNACEEGGVTFVLCRYDVGTDRANRQRTQLHIPHSYVACGVPIALYHREREVFLTASVANAASLNNSDDEDGDGGGGAMGDAMAETLRSTGASRRKAPTRASAVAAAMDADEVDGLGSTTIQPRLRKSATSGVVALQGADVAIHGSTAAAAATASTPQGSGPPKLPLNMNSFFDNYSMVSFTATMQQQEHALSEEKSLYARGFIDTGRGRSFPFPVFGSVNASSASSAKELTLSDANHSCTTAWCFEQEDPTEGGPLRFGPAWRYRLRHVVSGLYLAVCGSAVDSMLDDIDEDDEGDADGTPSSGTNGYGDEAILDASSESDAETRERIILSRKARDRQPTASPVMSDQGTRTPSTPHNAGYHDASSAYPRATRPTSLCLIPEPHSRREMVSTVFTIESMYTTESQFLIEQNCFSLKNVLTGMYVITDASTEGGDVPLSLDWHPSTADPIVVSYVTHRLEKDTSFIAAQCVWLTRYRAQMQALVLANHLNQVEVRAAASKGDTTAQEKLHEIERRRASTAEKINALFDGPDPDAEIMAHRRSAMQGVSSAAVSPSKITKSTDFAPDYASISNTILLCQRSLEALINFCSRSDDPDALLVDGLPIRSRQALLYEMGFHRLLFDVLLAPFALLGSLPIAEGRSADAIRPNALSDLLTTAMVDNPSELVDLLKVASLQQTDMSALWSGAWSSHYHQQSRASQSTHGGLATEFLQQGLLTTSELALAEHKELHLLCRLALRLLQQMIRGDAATFATGWASYIPLMLEFDGLRLHVVDTLQEVFTDNPGIPLRAVQQVSEHFINAARVIRRADYIDFLGAACTIKYKGVPDRQRFVCQKLLVENPHSICRFTVVTPPGCSESDSTVYVSTSLFTSATASSPRKELSTSKDSSSCGSADSSSASRPTDFVPFQVFFSSSRDVKETRFVENQIALFSRLCYDGSPDVCRRVVTRLFPAAAMLSLLKHFVWTGEQVVGSSSSNDRLRSHLLRLAMQCFVWPTVSNPAVQLRVSTVLFGSSTLRVQNAQTYSGLPDTIMTQLLKAAVVHLLEANPYFIQQDTDRSILLRAAVSVWLRLTRYRQYTHEEAQQVIPLLLGLLDGTKDILDRRALNRKQAAEGSRFRHSRYGAYVADPPSGPSGETAVLPKSWTLPPSASAATKTTKMTRFAMKVESVHLMRIREMICQALFLILQHEAFRAADVMILQLYKAYTAPDAGGPGRDGFGQMVGRLLRVPMEAMQRATTPFSDAVAVMVKGGKESDEEAGPGEISPLLGSAAQLAAQREAEGYRSMGSFSSGEFISPASNQLQAMWSNMKRLARLKTDASASYSILSSSSSDSDDADGEAGHLESPSSGTTMKARGSTSAPPPPLNSRSAAAEEVQYCLDYETHRIVGYFEPSRLLPLLLDLTRYDCKPLTVQAMNLMVQLCVVKQSIAQLVLKVNTLPSLEVTRSFDKLYKIAVQLREAYRQYQEHDEDVTIWDEAITATMSALLSTGPKDKEGAGHGDGVGGAEVVASAATAVDHGDRAATTLSTSAAAPLSTPPSDDDEDGDSSDSKYDKTVSQLRTLYVQMSTQTLSVGDLLANDDVEDDESGHGTSCTGPSNASLPHESGNPTAVVSETKALETEPQRKKRIAGLWNKTSGATRMLIYSNTIRNRRRSLGLSETSTIPIRVIVCAEMMAHWRIHETLLLMLPDLLQAASCECVTGVPVTSVSSATTGPLPHAQASLRNVVQFFYYFSFSESNVLLLRPYLPLFMKVLATQQPAVHTICLHIIMKVLASVPEISEYLTIPLLTTIVSHIDDEVHTKLPDSELVELLSRRIFSKTSVNAVVRRRVLILLRERGTLEFLSQPCRNPSPLLTTFMSALVHLLCSICGTHTSVLTLAKSILPAEDICGIVLQRTMMDVVQRSPKTTYTTVGTDATPHAPVQTFELVNPYLRALVALYFIPRGGNADDGRRHRLQWMGSLHWWSIASFFISMLRVVCTATKEDDVRVVNRGITCVIKYRSFFCTTLPITVAAFLINCYSNEGFERYYHNVIGDRAHDLFDGCIELSKVLMQHCAALSLTVEEVVHCRRMIGVICYELEHIDPTLMNGAAVMARRCDEVRTEMRHWLASQKRNYDAASAHVAQHEASSRRRRRLTRLSGDSGSIHNEDEVGAFNLLFSEEAVSQAQLQTQEVLEEKVVLQQGSPKGGYLHDAEAPDGAINAMGLLLPGALASNRGVTAIRMSLRATLRGDSIVPSLRRCSSSVALMVNDLLLRCVDDGDIRSAITRIMDAIRSQALRPRTFVGLLNLFYNALDTALHYPHLAKQSLSREWNHPDTAASSFGNAPATVNGSEGRSSNAVDPMETLGYRMQMVFNDAGMLGVVVSLCGIEENIISFNAIRLGVLIMEGGNRHVQTSLLKYFVTREEGFFHNVRDILRKNLLWVEVINADHQHDLMRRGMRSHEVSSAASAANFQMMAALNPRQSSGASVAADSTDMGSITASKAYVTSLSSGGGSDSGADRMANYKVAGWERVYGCRRLKLITSLFRLLQLFCEGHFIGLQNYIRSQHDNLHSANIIHETMVFLDEVSLFTTPSNYRVILQGFELLTEMCQGPCRQNQISLIDFGACRTINHVIDHLQRASASSAAPVPDATLTVIQGGGEDHTAAAAADMAEGNIDYTTTVRQEEANRLRVSVSNTLLALLEGCRDADLFRRVLRQISLSTIAAEAEIALHPSTVHYIEHDGQAFESNRRVEALLNFLIFSKSIEPYAELEGVGDAVADLLESCKSVVKYLGSIEIKRKDGLLERVYFHIPLICSSLTQERKDELLWSVDRTSRATKLADFLHMSDAIIFAVEQNHAFQTTVKRWTRCTLEYNSPEEKISCIQRSIRWCKQWYNHYIASFFFPYELARYDAASMIIAVAVNTIFLLLESADSTRSSVQQYADVVSQVLCVTQTIICAILVYIYLAVFFPIRLYVLYKNKQRFAAGKAQLDVDIEEVYSGLTTRERLHSLFSWFELDFRIFLLVMALLSCIVSHYFAAFNLTLLIYSISTLRTFIVAITLNGRQLLLTSLLGVIMLYLFSIVGFLSFPSQYDPEEEDGGGTKQMNCRTLLECFSYILDQGLRAGGGVGDVMRPWSWNNQDRLPRLAYDMLFYAIVTVVFLNILFGIIIDTFGQMRDEKREKEADMHGFCFICGLNADTLETASVSGFSHHIKEDHNMWMYLYFLHHLRRKDPSDYTGQESYVSAHIQRNSLQFFPEENCIMLVERAAAAAETEVMESEAEDTVARDGGGDDDGSADRPSGRPARANATTQAVVKEMMAARDALQNSLREWQSDGQRFKAILQQFELMSQRLADSSSRCGGGAESTHSRQSHSFPSQAVTLTPLEAVSSSLCGPRASSSLKWATGMSYGVEAGSTAPASTTSASLGAATATSSTEYQRVVALLRHTQHDRTKLEKEKEKYRRLLEQREAELKQWKKESTPLNASAEQ